MSRFNKNRGGGGRRDAKSISKNRFAALDADILSAYDDEDENPPPRYERGQKREGLIQQQVNRIKGVILGGRRNKDALDRQNLLSAAGKNTELIHKVTVAKGRAFGERWLLKQLYQHQIPHFKPLMMNTTSKGEIEFFLKSDEAADMLRAINRRIINGKTGERVTIAIRRVPAPWSRLSKSDVAVINEVVDSRYNEPSKALDLSEFALDPKFRQRDMHMMLNKNNVMLAVVERIDEKYGSITALSLKGNRLRYLDYLSMLIHVCKFVSVLDISDNQIENIGQLMKLKGLPVKTIFFEGNPMCEQFTKASDYLNAIHQVFPKVIGLDGQEVPAAVQNDMDEEDEISNEPVVKAGFYSSDDIQSLVETFIVEYMKQYDGENGATTRKGLVPAYDADNSCFTLTIQNLADVEKANYHDNELFSNYIRSSHNVLQEDRWSRQRATRSFRGAMEIAVQLAKLPITNHYQESFAVDVHLVSPQLLGFTLQGLFEDGTLAKSGTLPKLSYFSRSFYVAPRGEGAVAILSDMLYISAIVPDRLARYKLLINKALNAQPSAAPTTQLAESQLPSEDIRNQMLEQFCKDSGMKPDWSLKCLEDSNWNYELAGTRFTEMRPQIPAEAFAPTQ